jgi:hypothetical protein
VLSTLLLLTMLVPTLASPAKAQAVPGERSIEIFHNREMVSIVGYDPGSLVMIEVVRNGQTVGAVTRTVLPDGTYEINHTGAGANDCWGPGVEGRDDPVDPQHPNQTPDIKPGDTVRTTILSGPNEGQTNTAVTRDVALDFDALVADEGDPDLDGDGTVTVQGHVKSLPGAEIDFDRGDVVGIGLRKENRDSPWGDGQDGRKVLGADLTAADIAEDGTFTYQFTGIVEEDIEDVQTNGVSQSIEWTPAVVEPALPSELTVYDASEGVPPGCPPLEGATPVEEPAPNVNQDLGPNANLSAPVEEGRTMEIVHGIEFVVLEGYPADAEVRVDVVRGKGQNAVVVGSTTQRTDGTGLMEINHLGEGQFPDGDCWDYPGTPDIQPGDVVMATVLGPQGSDSADVDTSIVRDVFIEPADIDATNNTITIKGHARDVTGAPIDRVNDVLELRLNAAGFDWQSGDRPGRKDMRAQVTNFDDGDDDPTTFTHTFQVTATDITNARNLGFEQGLEWSPAVVEPEEPKEITVFNGTDLEGVGCPPHLGGTPAVTPDTANAITGSSHKYVNSANQGAQGAINVNLSGTSYGKDQVQVTVAGAKANATPVPVDQAVPNGLQTWRATVSVNLRVLPQGPVEATATFVDSEAAATDPVASDTAEMMKDTVRPANPTSSVPGGSYPTAQRVTLTAGDGDRVYYSTNRPDPDTGQPITGTLYTSPILVNEQGVTRITAVAVDKAGNVSAGNPSWNYNITARNNVIPTITNMTPADGTTVRDKRSTVAATVSDSVTNLSRNNIRLTIRGEEIRTFSYNRTTDRLTYTPRKNFRPGATPVRIVAVDEHGGRARADWTFTVRR